MAPDPLAPQPGPAGARRLARARPARLQLPPERHRGGARDRPARALRRDPRARARGGGAATPSCSARSTGSSLPCADDADHRRSWFVYVVLFPDSATRERVIATFEREGIGYNRYLPSIHLQPYMVERFGFEEGLCPVSEDVSSRSLALPFFTGIEAGRAGACRRGSRVGAVNLQSLDRAEPFTTKDGSTIRELHHTAAQSLAEAALEPGQATERHYHAPDRGDLLRHEGVRLARGGRRDADAFVPATRSSFRRAPGTRSRTTVRASSSSSACARRRTRTRTRSSSNGAFE